MACAESAVQALANQQDDKFAICAFITFTIPAAMTCLRPCCESGQGRTDGHHGAISELLANGRLDEGVSLDVHVGCCLVQD